MTHLSTQLEAHMKTIIAACLLLLLSACQTTVERHGKWEKKLTPEWPRQLYGKQGHESNPCVDSVMIEWAKNTKPQIIGYPHDIAACPVSVAEIDKVVQEHYVKNQLDPDEVKLLKRVGIGGGVDVATTLFCMGKGFKEGNALLGSNPAAIVASVAVPYALFYVVAWDTPVYRSLALDKSYNAVAGIRFAAGVRNLIICT